MNNFEIIEDDLLSGSIDVYDEMAKTVKDVFASEDFKKEWLKINNGNDATNLKNHLNAYPELNNPPIKDKRYKNLKNARKLRWNSKTDNASNTGDLRVINAYIPRDEMIYLLLCYSKSQQKDLTPKQAKVIDSTIEMLRNNSKRKGNK